jgi:hypothetical protein
MLALDLRSSISVLRDRKGQFVPLTTMILFTTVLLMIAAMNVYRIAKAKLQVQNMADAAALAVASMEAKAVNTVVDRNEWLNHMYGAGYTPKPGVSLPSLSQANNYHFKQAATAQAYAQLVATINKAQGMFALAYNNFLGAPPQGGNNTASNGSGNAALADILSEITGLQDPHILAVSVYNNNNARSSADQNASTIADAAANSGARTFNLGNKLAVGMQALQFDTVEVPITADKSKAKSLSDLAGGKVGWMHPRWDLNTLDVQVSKNSGTQPRWGAGVTIVKEVPLFLFGMKKVRATSQAYVVNAGVDSGNNDPKNPTLPRLFKPEFYAQLAYHP